MAVQRNHVALRASAAVALAFVALLAACNGGEGGGTPTEEPTATEPATARATDTAQTPSAEMGEAPIFWSMDPSTSPQVNTRYKILFRVTSGYEGAEMRIVAAHEGGSATAEFAAARVETAEDEAPGSYYPFNLVLPRSGTWQVTATAGDDDVTFSVNVAPSGSSAR